MGVNIHKIFDLNFLYYQRYLFSNKIYFSFNMLHISVCNKGNVFPLTLSSVCLSRINWFSALNLSCVSVLCLWPPHQSKLIELTFNTKSSDNEVA